MRSVSSRKSGHHVLERHIEAVQHLLPLLFAFGDLIKFLFNLARVANVHEAILERLLQESAHGNSNIGCMERATHLLHILTRLDRIDDRRIR